MQLEFREADLSRWADFERLFEARGGPKYCWCMAWRAEKAETGLRGPERKAAMRRRVEARVPIGILGYLEGEPIAWCSIAPRPTFRGLGGPEIPGERPEEVWSITCFFARRDLRKQGITRSLVEAAVEHARGKGAKVVEAYPVDPDSPSYRFMGYVSSFEAAGFRHVGRAGTRRHVMRLEL
ncbi:GNAT family N-acetyltransferase [Chelativorans sp.]|uniref:GNAT family N-acetyltransferase n=1 Tax=Chelativorans sp. TaxID=2203393 RepID=UPI0028118B3B|nr:GNAT family N-acetyltransferase [Chelativorans sp.]